MKAHRIDPIAQLADTFASAHASRVALERAFDRTEGETREAIYPAMMEARAAEEATSAAYRAALWEALEALELDLEDAEKEAA